jgi:MFS family permease
LACTVFILALWLTAYDNEAQITAFAVLFGFFSGAAIALAPVCVGQVSKVEDLGKNNGIAYFVASFGVLISIPIAACILEANNGDYSGVIVFGGIFYLAAFFIFVIARGISGGWKMARF